MTPAPEKTAAWTAGPWSQSHRATADGTYWTQVYRADDPSYEIASLHWAPRRLDDRTTISDREANARLIVASPALYETLDRTRAGLRHIQDRLMSAGPEFDTLELTVSAMIREVNAALSSATGEQS